MPENGNNPSELEKETIEQIVITIAIVDRIISDYKKPEDIMEDYRSMTSSDTKVAQVFASLALVNINNETGVFLLK